MTDKFDNNDALRIGADKLDKKTIKAGNISGKIAVTLSRNTTIYLSPKLSEAERQKKVRRYLEHIEKNGG